MEIHLKIIGVLLVILSLIHIGFPKLFKWDTELRSLSLINRQMMWIHTFFIAITLLLMGILCLMSADEMISTKLGKRICAGLGIFWTIRLCIQFWGYSPQLWRGKKIETGIHLLFTLFWIYLSFIFCMIAIG